jgi:hypothetical protein
MRCIDRKGQLHGRLYLLLPRLPKALINFVILLNPKGASREHSAYFALSPALFELSRVTA